MTTEIQIAIIASATSLLISIFTFIHSRLEQKRLRTEFEKSQRRAITTKLLDLRLEHYPKGFEITEMLQKTKGDNFDQNNVSETLHKLNLWRSGIVTLIISEETQFKLFEFRNTLRSHPGNNSSYVKEQVDKIWKSRNLLRRALRNDIGILHSEDENRIFDDEML